MWIQGRGLPSAFGGRARSHLKGSSVVGYGRWYRGMVPCQSAAVGIIGGCRVQNICAGRFHYLWVTFKLAQIEDAKNLTYIVRCKRGFFMYPKKVRLQFSKFVIC